MEETLPERPIVIGISGTCAAGKGTVVDYLVQEHGFVHYSVRAYLIEELVKSGITPDRPAMAALANELRRMHGPEHLVQALWLNACRHRRAIIESVRNRAEALFLIERSVVLVAVDAHESIRFARAVDRASSTDQVSLAEFRAQEAREMQSDDPAAQNSSAVFDHCDFEFANNGTREALIRDYIEPMMVALKGRD